MFSSFSILVANNKMLRGPKGFHSHAIHGNGIFIYLHGWLSSMVNVATNDHSHGSYGTLIHDNHILQVKDH